MKIVQVDNLLPFTGTGGQVYFCNNSLIHYENDLFLMTFRRMEFHIPNKSFLSFIHPWKMWDNGFKFLHPDPDHPDRTKNYGRAKYRARLSSDRFVSFSSDASHLIAGYKEFDSTGMAILRHSSSDGTFSVVHYIDNLFGSDMNQDCRISRDENGTLWLTYNGYFIPSLCKMIRRKIHLNMKQQFMYLYEEEELLPLSIQQPVEKNCVMDRNNKVCYSFHKGVFTVIREEGVVHKCPVPFLEEIASKYENRFIISLGTPPIEVWQGRHVAVGHIKMEFRHRTACGGMQFYDDSFQELVDRIDWTKIYQHGKFIYFMFFFEFNDDDNITRISDCFLPTDATSSHLPYLLSFPSGFTADRDRYNFWLSYGEGDVRCKILSFSRDDLDNLLLYPETRMGMGIRTQFLNVDEWNQRPKIFHVGYFFEKNCGDDMFRVVFQSLRDRFYPNHLALFRNEYKALLNYDAQRDKIVFGGGDIVNQYFLNELFRTDGLVKDAVSIGIPYIGNEHLLDCFRNICLRSCTDFKRLTIQSHLVYYPDLGFLMPRMISLNHHNTLFPFPTKRRPRLGVCLARTFFRKGNECEYIEFIVRLSEMLSALLPLMDVFLIPFCTRRDKRYEDDNVINSHVREFFREDSRLIDTSEWVIHGDPVFHTYLLMSNMDFMFCSRFHSHVFSIALEIPFVSFSRNRKVVNLMRECGLEDVVYVYEELEGLPIRLDVARLTAFVLEHFHQRKLTRHRLAELMIMLSQNMDQFLAMWKHYIESGQMCSPPDDDIAPSSPPTCS